MQRPPLHVELAYCFVRFLIWDAELFGGDQSVGGVSAIIPRYQSLDCSQIIPYIVSKGWIWLKLFDENAQFFVSRSSSFHRKRELFWRCILWWYYLPVSLNRAAASVNHKWHISFWRFRWSQICWYDFIQFHISRSGPSHMSIHIAQIQIVIAKIIE